ncbi:unnamed protein product [Mytilus coruscus]|uniref:Ig-like domain-containing protein n=1 Tax=Mytilus coruscus TaxID=42192 RepID=A0A6J8E4P8_MYTCO|nr:unnamed protein product [Mytilus coruscus]
MNRILVILYCLKTVALAGLSNKIYWTIEDLPFIYGRNVTFFCNTSAVGLQKTTWIKQSDVILHQSLSFYSDKYTGKEVNDGSSLTIKNISESDLNTTYTCLSDVYSYEAVVMINSSNFICLPQSIDITWNISGRNIIVQLNIERFFPVPKCRTMFNDDILNTNQQELNYLQGEFFHGNINITSKSAADLCGGNLTVVCMFGGSYNDAIETKILQDCNASHEEVQSLNFKEADTKTNSHQDKYEVTESQYLQI